MTTMRHKGFDFPTEPRTMSYLDIPGSNSPQVANRWQRVTGQMGDNRQPLIMDFFWRGTCFGCGRGTWSSPQDDLFNIESYLNTSMISDSIVENGKTYRTCQACTSASRQAIIDAATASSDSSKTPLEWPEEIIGDLMGARKVRAGTLKRWIEPHATAPAVGAYIMVGNAMHRFGSFTSDGKVAVHGKTETYPMDEVQVLTPAVHGVAHPDVVVMPHFSAAAGASSGSRWKVMRWSGINVTIRNEAGITKTISANAIAVPAPCVNPANESAEDKATRLEWALERVKESVHHRMVAEGVARDWCSTFDPILDSAGLPPRKEQAYYLLTMRVASDAVFDEAAMEKFLEQGWTSTFTARSLACIDIQREIKPSVAMLSL